MSGRRLVARTVPYKLITPPGWGMVITLHRTWSSLTARCPRDDRDLLDGPGPLLVRGFGTYLASATEVPIDHVPALGA
jgi:hypothetical protein